LSNRYYVRTTAASGTSATVEVAANLRPPPQTSTHSPPPPLAHSPALRATATATGSAEAPNDELLRTCGITDIDELARTCVATRSALGQPTGPLDSAVPIPGDPHGRGQPWLAGRARTDGPLGRGRRTRSPVRVAEAGPWWDSPAGTDDSPDDELAAVEGRLAELDAHRPALQVWARAELADEGLPVTRDTVTRRAVQILDRSREPA